MRRAGNKLHARTVTQKLQLLEGSLQLAMAIGEWLVMPSEVYEFSKKFIALLKVCSCWAVLFVAGLRLQHAGKGHKDASGQTAWHQLGVTRASWRRPDASWTTRALALAHHLCTVPHLDHLSFPQGSGTQRDPFLASGQHANRCSCAAAAGSSPVPAPGTPPGHDRQRVTSPPPFSGLRPLPAEAGERSESLCLPSAVPQRPLRGENAGLTPSVVLLSSDGTQEELTGKSCIHVAPICRRQSLTVPQLAQHFLLA